MGVIDGDGNEWFFSRETGRAELCSTENPVYLRDLSRRFGEMANTLPKDGKIDENVISIEQHQKAKTRKAFEGVAQTAARIEQRLELDR